VIIFFENGRLGNQLFQYCAMKKFKSDNLIVAVGMRELRDNFSGIEIAGASRFGRAAEKIIGRIGKNRIEFVAKTMRILTMVEEVRSPSGIEYRVTPGLFNSQIYFKAGYYQSEDMVDADIANTITLAQKNKIIADHFFVSLPGEDANRFFVHIRRGDYLNWPSHESPAVLPLHWYRSQMNNIRTGNPNALFVVVSDDKPYVDEFFSNEDDVVIACNDLMSDFAVMTKCLGGGVMSASSLSWWASYFIRRDNPDAYFVGPRYWAGSRDKKWHPECIFTSWISYEDAF
jgi:hypothetical protein